jgi:hypothetical protein
MNRLEELVEALVEQSGPRVRLGSRALEPMPGRGTWERAVKSLCGQIFTQGATVGWEKATSLSEEKKEKTVADYSTRVVTTTRKEYVLESPTNWAEVEKVLAAIKGDMSGGRRTYDDDVVVEARDDEVVFWFKVADKP